jgi:hypothetical protein
VGVRIAFRAGRLSWRGPAEFVPFGNGASDGEVAELIGDKSERMGKHYTRHVESGVSIVRAFERIKDRP